MLNIVNNDDDDDDDHHHHHHVNRVRLRLCTSATDGPIVHPPGDT
jgi:hypothetical protein